MANIRSEFEVQDKEGSTVLYAGAVGVTAVAIPTVAGKFIDEISIRCRVDQPQDCRLEFSFDNVVFHRLKVGEHREEEPRGSIKQVYIRAAGAGVTTVNYEIATNYGRLP